MRWFFQNLNEKPYGQMGSWLRHFRCKLYGDRRSVGLEWNCGLRWQTGVSLEVGGMCDGQWLLSLHVLGTSLYLHASGFFDKLIKAASREDGMEFGIGLNDDWRVQIDFGTRVMSWRSSDPLWRRGIRVDIPRLVLGDHRRHEGPVLADCSGLIPMPEGCYPSHITIQQLRWKRTRWPFSEHRYFVKVEIPRGIPHCGKGENSWDCGDDATYGVSFSEPHPITIEQIVGRIVAGCLRDRARYGEASWLHGRQPVMAPNAPTPPPESTPGVACKQDP